MALRTNAETGTNVWRDSFRNSFQWLTLTKMFAFLSFMSGGIIEGETIESHLIP